MAKADGNIYDRTHLKPAVVFFFWTAKHKAQCWGCVTWRAAQWGCSYLPAVLRALYYPSGTAGSRRLAECDDSAVDTWTHRQAGSTQQDSDHITGAPRSSLPPRQTWYKKTIADFFRRASAKITWKWLWYFFSFVFLNVNVDELKGGDPSVKATEYLRGLSFQCLRRSYTKWPSCGTVCHEESCLKMSFPVSSFQLFSLCVCLIKFIWFVHRCLHWKKFTGTTYSSANSCICRIALCKDDISILT